jgi:glycosyltransferase involved in cell wall biosynthesis
MNLNIAITVDPEIPVPPELYGGIERIVDLLARGLCERGHKVTLLAHPDSDTAGELRPYPGRRSQNLWDTLRNTVHVARLGFNAPDVVHSFGRLAYLTPLLPLGIPKIMSYQREPTLSQIRKAVWLSRDQTLIFTGCSEHIAEQIRPVAPAHAIYNGVPVDRFDFEPAVSDDAPLVFLGRIAPIKGTHHAIRVAKKSGRQLVIAGNVPEQPKEKTYFKEQVEPHIDGTHIQYLGPVNDEKKNELLGRAVAFLMPIEWEEPFGIVMAEALACGTPVIGLRRGSVPEVVTHGETGFACDSVNEMVEAVARIGELSRSACRKRCEEHFSARAIVDSYEQLYRRHVSS